MLTLDDLDYALPEDLVAQAPLAERDASRLLVVAPGTELAHRRFAELPGLLSPSLFVLNDTRVLRARLLGRKPTGGRAELLLVERLSPPGAIERWQALGSASKGLAPGQELVFEDGALVARVLARDEDGFLQVEVRAASSVGEALARVGHVPLPPYVKRTDDALDGARYQTVYARHEGAVAAPTAGLHLTETLLDALRAGGHEIAFATLHVGPGTFLPIRADRLDDHRMAEERYEIPEATAAAIARARADGRKVVAVGTTVVRALESAADDTGRVRVGARRTRLFIRPPFAFRVVDALVTNFHLPRSTLLALVMAFGGVERVRAAYRAAVESRYRFYSYGDAMLVTRRG